MTPGFLGLPSFAWGGLCLVVAAIWVVVYPKNMPRERTFRWFILRWGHALTWALLALAQFVRGVDPGLGGLADPIALLALPVYLAFLGATLTSRRPVER